MNTKSKVLVGLLAGLILMQFPSPVYAQTPLLINYQGRLLDGTNLVNGPVGLSLQLYTTASGGTILYEDSNTVTVVDGLYSTFIGDHTVAGNLVSALTNDPVWLQVSANGVALTPREQLASVPFALSVRGLAVTTNQNVLFIPLQNRVEASTAWATIGGGSGNLISNAANYTVVGGGNQNWIGANSQESVIDGGGFNRIGTNAPRSVIGGGSQNTVRDHANDSVVAGGRQNMIGIGAVYAVVSGGYNNDVSNRAEYAVISGGYNNQIGTNALVSVIGGGGGNLIGHATEGAFIGGGQGQRIYSGAVGSMIGGGSLNYIYTNAQYAAIAGGYAQNIGEGSSYSTIGGGNQNLIQPYTTYATISGGRNNNIILNASYSVIGGGQLNVIGNNAQHSTIAGGYQNEAQTSAQFGSIGGGQGNRVGNSSSYATVPGGRDNYAITYSLAAGRRAKAYHLGSFVWGDNTDADIATTADNQFLIRAGGGLGVNVTNIGAGVTADFGGRLRVRGNTPGVWVYDSTLASDRGFIGMGDGSHVGFYGHAGAGWGFLMSVSNGYLGVGKFNPAHTIDVANGAYLSAGGVWTSVSDANRKQNFEPVDTREILEKVAALPITTWSYITEPGVKHIGPTAQDFYAAFGVGVNEVSLSQIDPDGVALAAIQALAKENEDLKRENEAVKVRLEAIERLLNIQ